MIRDAGESYDLVAADYANEYRDELARKPFDRKMLDWLIEKVSSAGPICDVGCGPGQVATYIHEHGAESFGVDVSIEMVRQAQLLNPKIRFAQGDMVALDLASNTLGGIAAFYSLIHLPRAKVVDALKEFKRVLVNNGSLLIAYHIGTGAVHREEWFGKEVSLDFLFFEIEEMKEYISQAELTLEEVIQRDPYTDVEYPSRRAYIFAQKK